MLHMLTPQCTAKVLSDPGVEIVHIVILDDGNDTPDKGDARVNVFDKQIGLVCDKKNFRDK